MAPSRNRRPGFSRRAQYGLFLAYVGAVGGALIGAGLLLLSTFNPPAYAAVRSVFGEITTPISSVFAWAGRSITGIPAGVAQHFDVIGQNRALRAQLEDNETLVQRARTLNQENRRLRALLKLRDITPDAIVAARLVSSTGSSTRRYATLNAGRWQGVRPGQPVREADGLVGQVIEAGPNNARVLLIVDAESIVPVRRTRDGLPAIADRALALCCGAVGVPLRDRSGSPLRPSGPRRKPTRPRIHPDRAPGVMGLCGARAKGSVLARNLNRRLSLRLPWAPRSLN